jgi:hypothetical protein
MMSRRGLILGTLLLLTGCGQQPPEGLIILHTGRQLGNVYPLSSKGIAPLQYYPYLAGYVNRVRAEAKAQNKQVLLIDSGDSLSGSFGAHVTQSRNMIALFHYLRYDAIVTGNLDNALTPAHLAPLAPLPVLCPFIDLNGQSALAGTQLSVRLKKEPWFIDLFANFYGNTLSSRYPERFPSFFGGNPAVSVQPFRDYQTLLTSPSPFPARLRLLNYFKYEPGTETTQWLRQLNDLKIDAVLAHRIYPPKTKETWNSSPPTPAEAPVLSENILRQNRGFTVARLDLNLSGQKPKVTRKEIVQMTANTAPADPAVIQLMEQFALPIQQANEALLVLKRPWSKRDILYLYLQALAETPSANALLYSLESIRNDWRKGTLRTVDLFASLPWDNHLFLVTLTPEQWQRASQLPNLLTLEKSGPPITSYRVVTSAFYAALLRQQLKLTPEQLSPLETPTEFDLFLAYLKKQPLKLEATLPSGWITKTYE